MSITIDILRAAAADDDAGFAWSGSPLARRECCPAGGGRLNGDAVTGARSGNAAITIDRPARSRSISSSRSISRPRSGRARCRRARLDNEVELAERLGLSRPTVRAAFLYLANKGMVVRKRGAGTLVAKERIDRDVELTSLYDDLAAAGARRPPR